MSRLQIAATDLYRDVWTGVPHYGEMSPGERHVALFQDMARPDTGSFVFDAGCGSGKGAMALAAAGFSVRMGDLTDAGLVPEARGFPFRPICLWQSLKQGKLSWPPDYVYCTDVLEHLSTAYTMLAVRHMLDYAKRGVFLSVGVQDDIFGYLAGASLHQTVQPFTWWRDHLAGIGRVVAARDLVNAAAFYLVRD